jgi:hypothetical protein
VHADFAHGLGQLVVTGEQGTPIAIAAQRLAGKEAGAADRGQVAALSAAVRGAEALGGVLDDGEVVAQGPYRDTGMMARVRAVIFSSISPGAILQVTGSMSTNTGVAPSSTMASAVAMKVKGVVITSSPRPTPSAISAISNASVPEATVMQWRAPVYRARRSSSSATSGPMMYWPWSRTAWMRPLIRSRDA